MSRNSGDRSRRGRSRIRFDQFWSLAERANVAQDIRDSIRRDAPDLFAVVQLNASLRTWWVSAWGLRFPNHTEVIDVQGERFDCESPDYARWHYDVGEGIRAAVVDLGVMNAGSDVFSDQEADQ